MFFRIKLWFTLLLDRIYYKFKPEPKAAYDELVEMNRLLIKAGQRCNYDLAHLISIFTGAKYYTDEEIKYNYKVFSDRQHYWKHVFDPVDGGKRYKDKLHIEISDLSYKVEILEKLCDENNIEVPYDRIPF